ncbi:YcxB family protein [Streptacidiphilus sp. P02-A3a]|uniref:YcxB family protein n=1 Tax=Streptacidiphilus sp. P02-A3a TaxID=2704468 RepID=UPI0015F8671C|nr:YcxB family protein [Streptacidiphilus sp. P02-A3a]QMU73207.1 YcxB family protein [Streptacidiphilus sp. P02-A3a]
MPFVFLQEFHVHITATYQLSPAEARRGLNRVKRRQRMNTAVFAGVFALMSALDFAQHNIPLGVFFGSVCALYGIMVLLSTRISVRKNASRLCGVHTVTLKDEFLAAETDMSRSETKWAALLKSEETPEFFLLYGTKYSAAILPRRAFTAEQNAEFGAFLAKQTFRR